MLTSNHNIKSLKKLACTLKKAPMLNEFDSYYGKTQYFSERKKMW